MSHLHEQIQTYGYSCIYIDMHPHIPLNHPLRNALCRLFKVRWILGQKYLPKLSHSVSDGTRVWAWEHPQPHESNSIAQKRPKWNCMEHLWPVTVDGPSFGSLQYMQGLQERRLVKQNKSALSEDLECQVEILRIPLPGFKCGQHWSQTKCRIIKWHILKITT